MTSSSSISAPIVIIFERHWDEVPKQLVKELLPKLAEECYDTLCFEIPHNLSASEIVSRHEHGLAADTGLLSQAEQLLTRANIRNTRKLSDIGFGDLANLMRGFVSSKRYNEVAEKIKGLPASLIVKDILKNANRLLFDIKGVDIEELDDITSIDMSKRVASLDRNEDYRIRTIVDNLLRLHEEGRGVIFVCGALHANNLMTQFKKTNAQDNVVCYFPHSSKRYDDSYDDIEVVIDEALLKDHAYCVLKDTDIASLAQRVIRDIKSTNTNYQEEVVGNTHSAYLSKIFGVEFQAFERPRHYVDALLDLSQNVDVEGISGRLQEVGIHTHQTSLHGHTYLVIPEVNTTAVAENIRRL